MRYEQSVLAQTDHFKILYGAGEYPAEERALHYDNAFTVSFFFRCEGRLWVEGREYPVRDGDAVLIRPSEIHLCEAAAGSGHERLSLFIAPSLASALPFEAAPLFDCFVKRDAGEGNLITAARAGAFGIERAARALLEAARTGGEAVLYAHLILLLTRLSEAAKKEELPQRTENKTVEAVTAFIAEHLCEELSCERIASHFYISKYRLEHIFKEAAGVSLWDYVILKRLLLCNERIAAGDTVKEAAYTAGFRNYSNFYRLYKKHMGAAPSKCKKQF